MDYLIGKSGLSPPCLFLFLLSGPLCVRQSACPRIWLSHDCGFPITPALPPNQHSPVPSSFIRMDGNSTLKGLISFFLFLGFQRGHRGRWAPEVLQTLIPLLTCGRHSAALPRWPSSWSSEVPVAEVDWGPAGWFSWTSNVSGSRISWGFQNGWEGHLQRHSLYFSCVSVCVLCVCFRELEYLYRMFCLCYTFSMVIFIIVNRFIEYTCFLLSDI